MKYIIPFAFLMLSQFSSAQQCAAIFDTTISQLHTNKDIDLCEVTKGKKVLVVNTASECGFSGQFEELQAVYKSYQDDNFTIIGFPSNDFAQEYSDDKDIADFCYINYGVKFTMSQPVEVTGNDAHPIFKSLVDQGAQSPKWNFYKYLIDEDGQLIEDFSSVTKPDSKKIISLIEG